MLNPTAAASIVLSLTACTSLPESTPANGLQRYLQRSESLYRDALEVQHRIEHLKAVQYGIEEDTDPLSAEIARDIGTFEKAQEYQRKSKMILEPCGK